MKNAAHHLTNCQTHIHSITSLNQLKDGEKIVAKVSAIQAEDSPDEVRRKRQEQAAINTLKALSVSKAHFPYQGEINLSILRAKPSQALTDFEREIQKLGSTIASQEVFSINMCDVQEITQAIHSATGNVLVVLLGDGEASQFECFDKMAVLQALTKFKGYRLLGLHHTQHATLANLVCNHTANTPAQAGVHLVQMVRRYEADLQARLTDLRKVSQSHIKELGSFLSRSYDSIDQLTAENQVMNESISQAQKQLKRLLVEKEMTDQRIQNTRRLAKICLPLVFALGMIFTHWFLR